MTRVIGFGAGNAMVMDIHTMIAEMTPVVVPILNRMSNVMSATAKADGKIMIYQKVGIAMEEYEPFGHEWEKEMMKANKKWLISQLKAEWSPKEDHPQFENFIRAFWRRIEPYKEKYGKELPEKLPVEFRASMATALLQFSR